jgi:hypothetical protein
VPLLAYWAVVIVWLVYDNREPSSTLVWLSLSSSARHRHRPVPLLRELEGDHRAPALGRRVRGAVTAKMRPVYERNQAADRPSRSDTAPVSRPPSATIARERLAPLPADSVEIFPTGAENFARLEQDLAAAIVRQHGVLHLGARPAHGQDHGDPP